MNRDAMVFAMANPNPEITPEEAEPYARVIATGRSDYPNQINNVLCFPGIFRGALDVRARDITEEMKMAAARGIASIVADDELREDYVIPSVFNRDVADAVAAAVADRGQGPGHGRGPRRRGRLLAAARPRSSAPSGPERRTPDMRVTITGASGLIGTKLAPRSKQRGDEVTPLSLRNGPPDLGRARRPRRVVHLAGENVAQRWTDDSRKRDPTSRASRARAARRGDRRTPTRSRSALISSSAVGYYGPHGDEQLDEDTPPGDDFLAPRSASPGSARPQQAAARLRVVRVRTGVVLDKNGGALAKMLLPFKLGGGGPVAGGEQYMPWIHVDDVVGIYLAAIDDARWTGPVNATAPEPVTNKDVQQGARPCAAPPRGRARSPGFAIRAALRRHGRDRHRGPARRSEAHAGARLHVPAPRSRRGTRRRR